MRNNNLEQELQECLDAGHSVWVIGDIHGFSVTFENLVDVLQLSEHDKVVVLGDLIDRGPDSYHVVKIVQSDSRIYSVKGNHEQMMIKGFIPEQLESPKHDSVLWLRNGGIATTASYLRAFTDKNGVEDSDGFHTEVNNDRKWMRTLPTHIILNKWRLVHAGYDPRTELDEQGEAEHLWIRDPFHNAKTPIDNQRSVVFGHTPTMTLPGVSNLEYGNIWYSAVKLKDDRSASIGLDTCLFHQQQLPAVLSAINLQTMEVRQMPRVEAWGDEARHRAMMP